LPAAEKKAADAQGSAQQKPQVFLLMEFTGRN